MEKSLYSLMLMDDVVKAIDALAFERNTNRSNLVNQILAEYVSMTTPEKRIDSIFRCIEEILNRERTIVPYVPENAHTMQMKSSLEYKYRPTIKYEVELYRIPRGAIGELSVIFRTQSGSLISAVNNFLSFWMKLEETYLSEYFPELPVEYKIKDGKFVWSIKLKEGRDYSAESVGDAISAYITNFDKYIKGWLTGRYTSEQIEKMYAAALREGVGIL